jgi:aspartate kinase
MGSAVAMRLASDIVRACRDERIVVVSAVSGTTDALIALGKKAESGGDWETSMRAIRAKHENIVRELGLMDSPQFDQDLLILWKEMESISGGVARFGELSPSVNDRLLSLGERLSGTIFAQCLTQHGTNAAMVDAVGLVATDREFGAANVDFELTRARTPAVLGPLLVDAVVPVVTGFIGQSHEPRRYTTLGRGGSDYSGAIIAAVMRADELQIWTDVDGMFTADPRFIPAAKVVPELSYAEAGELAYFGAKVLHPKTILPAIEKGIPVRVLNTFNASAPGTLITAGKRPSLKSVTWKKGISVVNISSLGMFGAYGFLAKAFEVFGRHQVVVDVLASSEVSVSVTVDGELPRALLRDLEAFSTVEVEPEKQAIVCLVGEGIHSDTNVLWKLFHAVRATPVRMVSQGASRRNITFVVAETEAQSVVERVFQTFFAS